jgi:hypothetical protein
VETNLERRWFKKSENILLDNDPWGDYNSIQSKQVRGLGPIKITFMLHGGRNIMASFNGV